MLVSKAAVWSHVLSCLASVFRENAIAVSCRFLLAQHSFALSSIDASSSWKTTRLRWIHRLVMQMLLRILHVRFLSFAYSSSSSGCHRRSFCLMTVESAGAVRPAQLPWNLVRLFVPHCSSAQWPISLCLHALAHGQSQKMCSKRLLRAVAARHFCSCCPGVALRGRGLIAVLRRGNSCSSHRHGEQRVRSLRIHCNYQSKRTRTLKGSDACTSGCSGTRSPRACIIAFSSYRCQRVAEVVVKLSLL
jgi:hypothetical protein